MTKLKTLYTSIKGLQDLGLPRAIGSKCRRPHFYHKQVVDCSVETYLHKLTKHIFKERFDKAEHYEITYPISKECSAKGCPLRNEQCKKIDCTTTVDLKQYYDTCQEEMPIDDYTADLLLTNSTKPDIPPILVELSQHQISLHLVCCNWT